MSYLKYLNEENFEDAMNTIGTRIAESDLRDSTMSGKGMRHTIILKR
jgi:hypothetical protein